MDVINKNRLTFGTVPFLERDLTTGLLPLPVGGVMPPELGEVGGVRLAASSNVVTVKFLSGIAPKGLES